VIGIGQSAIVDGRIAEIAESSMIRPIVNRRIVNESPDRQSSICNGLYSWYWWPSTT
jgi:hypothetical protein